MIVKNTRLSNSAFSSWMVTLAAAFFCGLCLAPSLFAQGTQPLVAIHDSEYTRALETMPAVAPTPGAGTGGMQWWATDWHYFVMPDAAKDALTSDGTAYTVIGDSNIVAGLLLSNGAPKYPIIISMEAEAMSDAEIAPLTNYVAAGGFLFISGGSFTRRTNGTTRGDFAFANQMGVHSVVSSLTNWGDDNTITRQFAHRLVSHLPDGQLTWRLPSYSEEINWGISTTSHNYMNSHDFWQINASDATVVAMGDSLPYLTVKPYGKGYFIYEAAFNPLVAHGGFGPGMYAYTIMRNAIEWAFQSSTMPVLKLSPWPYQYDAAMMERHDLEDYDFEITNIEASATIEAANGVKGDYYFCTGTLKTDMVGLGYDTNAVVKSLRRAMTNSGATISSHNGGLKNPGNNGLSNLDYDYWHWGLDEALDFTTNGTLYATQSLSNSLKDIESWLPQMSPSMRTWVSPNFNATREASYNLQSQLNVKIGGDQKISPFPHWTLSTQTPDKRYPMLTEPVSEWFVGGSLAQSLESWHPPGVQTSGSLHTSVDFYYSQGSLINFYSHTMSTGVGTNGGAGPLVLDYITYCMNTNLHPRLWSANGIGVYQWWLARSNASITASYSTNGLQSIATINVSGATDPNTAVEALIPGSTGFCNMQVLTNGVAAGTNVYRNVNNQLVRVKVGTSVTNVVVSYYLRGLGAMVFLENFDGVTAPALPSGWTTSSSGAESNWKTQTGTKDSSPNALIVPDPSSLGLSSITSPQIFVPAGAAQLSFRNNYNLEPGPGNSVFDGGILQIKIGTNAFVDIIAAGGSFVSGGYIGTIAPDGTSQLAGSRAWSGNSGGFINTIINLPAAASGQTNQFQWVCATDQGSGAGSFTGWVIDTVAVTNLVCLTCSGGNNPPVLQSQSNQTINEGTTMIVTNTATDLDGNVLTYTLTSAPTNATIDLNGIITWTPTESQGPSSNNVFTMVVSDCTGLSATNSFNITVNEINTAPVPASTGTQTINELTLMTVTNAATDSDIPANTLTYSLLSAPAGVNLDTNTGIITWTPTESQGPSTNTIFVVVTDFNPSAVNSQHLSATNNFKVIVKEVNTAPVLPHPGDVNMNEGDLLVVTNTATDSDIPSNTLSYQLISPPQGMNIDSNGVITWIPSGTQGPSTNVITTVVTDFNVNAPAGTQQLTATNKFNVVVNDTLACQYVTFYQENFDGVTAPALPSGWTTSFSGVESNWVTQTSVKDSGPNALFSPDVTNVGSNSVVTPVIATPAGTLILSFRNNYAFEIGTGTDGFDGGVMEIQIGTNGFNDILAAGGSFVSGGYNAVVDTQYFNPLKGRQAWSGNSGGFITTTVTLPSSASSTNIQIRWVTGTDNGNGGNGWRIDTLAISNLVCSAPGPVLPSGLSNKTIGEFSTLTVTNTATEIGAPPLTLTYQLIAPPAGATINSNGIISWSPSQTQSPSTNLFTTLVTDNSSPTNLSASNSFTVFVTEVNLPPTPPTVGPQTINETLTLTVTNTATETNIHSVTTGYGLVSPQTGMVISSNGVFTWTPQPNQSPSVNTVTIVTTNSNPFDLVNPILKITNSFTVTVKEINIAPILVSPGLQIISETLPLTVTNVATEPNIHAVTTGFGLIAPLTGMAINSNGVFTWTPQQNQSPSTNTVTVVVTNLDSFDTVNPILTTTNTFVVKVIEVNIAPVLPHINPQTVNELITLTVTNTATQPNVHAATTGYGLIAPLSGMNISSNGIFTWAPQPSQSPTNVTVTVVVTNLDAFDTVNPVLTATNSFTVAVKEVNIAPILLSPGLQSVNETQPLTVTNVATEPNPHAVTTGFGLIAPLTGMAINSNGVFTWTPQQSQSPSTNTITVVVTNLDSFDTVNPILTTTNTFVVKVIEVNIAPILLSPGLQTINETQPLTVTNVATEPNIHSTTTGFGLIAPLTGMGITSNGVFTWTPQQNQSPSTNTVTVVVTNFNAFDTVNPILTATNSFVVKVIEVNVAAVLPTISAQSVGVGGTLTVTNTASEPNIHATTTGYKLLMAPAGMTISGGGIISWSPNASFVGTTNTVTTVVTNSDTFDLVNPQLLTTNSFTVAVTGVHNGPSLAGRSGVTINELTTLIVTNTAVDNDIPLTTLNYHLVNPPSGATIDSNGIITWAPTSAQSSNSYAITTVVTDSATSPLSATNSFNVTVAPVTPPTITSIGITNAIATVTWSATAGHTYRLQYKALVDPTWTEIAVDVVAQSSSASTTNASSGSALRLYRVSDGRVTVRQ